MSQKSPAIERRHGFLSATGLKLIALAAMTIDHIAVYCFEFELVLQFREQLRLVGRIAAPLFLFCVVESVRHTKSRKKIASAAIHCCRRYGDSQSAGR